MLEIKRRKWDLIKVSTFQKISLFELSRLQKKIIDRIKDCEQYLQDFINTDFQGRYIVNEYWDIVSEIKELKEYLPILQNQLKTLTDEKRNRDSAQKTDL